VRNPNGLLSCREMGREEDILVRLISGRSIIVSMISIANCEIS
jgi:hypothetical protein